MTAFLAHQRNFIPGDELASSVAQGAPIAFSEGPPSLTLQISPMTDLTQSLEGRGGCVSGGTGTPGQPPPTPSCPDSQTQKFCLDRIPT